MLKISFNIGDQVMYNNEPGIKEIIGKLGAYYLVTFPKQGFKYSGDEWTESGWESDRSTIDESKLVIGNTYILTDFRSLTHATREDELNIIIKGIRKEIKGKKK